MNDLQKTKFVGNQKSSINYFQWSQKIWLENKYSDWAKECCKIVGFRIREVEIFTLNVGKATHEIFTLKNIHPRNIHLRNIHSRNIPPRNIESANYEPQCGAGNPENIYPKNIHPGNILPKNIHPTNIYPRNIQPRNIDSANCEPRLMISRWDRQPSNSIISKCASTP